MEGRPRAACTAKYSALLGATSDKRQADHINQNTLDNRRSNLRIATNAENSRNRRRQRNNRSGYRRVSYYCRAKRWQAYISVDERRRVWLGYFDTPEKAAQAYDFAAITLHGDFAQTNFRYAL